MYCWQNELFKMMQKICHIYIFSFLRVTKKNNFDRSISTESLPLNMLLAMAPHGAYCSATELFPMNGEQSLPRRLE